MWKKVVNLRHREQTVISYEHFPSRFTEKKTKKNKGPLENKDVYQRVSLRVRWFSAAASVTGTDQRWW